MEEIVSNKAYKGMPDTYYDLETKRIQWEAPSNRKSGKFRKSHQHRRSWWVQKAKSLGIKTNRPQWISRVAKTIHPSKRKPCKICGREMDLLYVYPQIRLLKLIKKKFSLNNSYAFDPLEPLPDLLVRLHDEFGGAILKKFPQIFEWVNISLPAPNLRDDIEEWIKWVINALVPTEPRSFLGPGAMSNAPDRFDGFHCDNRCCRGTHDKGRNPARMAFYATDRRVFEFWSSGNWVAADRLIGEIRARFFHEKCSQPKCKNTRCHADHIGPLSLGFNHRPKFQLLCSAHNSAKNNRMLLSDVQLLIADEVAGEDVISWHSKPLWDMTKNKVKNSENALRLSKLLRDNRHNLMFLLKHVYDAGNFAFLAKLLELQHADSGYEFLELSTHNGITRYKELISTPRETKYAVQQKARRCRIAFGELSNYFKKLNRNAYIVKSQELTQLASKITKALISQSVSAKALDRSLSRIIKTALGKASDESWRSVVENLQACDCKAFQVARGHLEEYMTIVGGSLTELWDDPRYVRA